MGTVHRILIVDDHEPSRSLLAALVRSLGYEVETARDGLEALAKLPLDIDLVLLDVVMPGLDGFQIARRIRSHSDSRDLPIIMVTALDSREDRLRAVDAGASDFIAKPVESVELRARVGSQLRLKEAQDELKRHRAELSTQVAAKTLALRQSLDETVQAQREAQAAHLDSIHRLVLAAGFRDHGIGTHIHRIGAYIRVLARALPLPPSEVENLVHAAPLHDVGKIAIPDAILLKAGPLTVGEQTVMRSHTVIGAQILAGAVSKVIQTGEVIALTHHERWDGTGYPCSLAGEAIPLPGRLCAVVDVFDALTSSRPYREPLSEAGALALMKEERGRHFDPEVFDVFDRCFDEIRSLKAEMGDEGVAAVRA
jgi:putative two-component system response regulator